MYEKGISICITAYKAVKYIKQTLDSVYRQTWFKNHDNWEVIVGVDGCNATLEYLQTIRGNYKNLRIYMMDSNVGTYITTNTIMSLAKYDGLIRFDSDDIMRPYLVERIMSQRNGLDFISFRMKNFGTKNTIGISIGPIYIRHEIFDEFGGYRPWKCGADSEIKKRIEKFIRIKTLKDILFDRRLAKTNLTTSNATNGKSEIRKKYKKIVAEMVVEKKKDAIIEKITSPCTEIDENQIPVKKKQVVKKRVETCGKPEGKIWNTFFA